MGALTPSFVFDFESGMQAITENEYLRLAKELWWSKLAKVRQSSHKQEIIAWLLSTAQIRSTGLGGNAQFDDLVSLSQTYVNRNSGAGLRMTKDQLEDLDGSGLDVAQKWSGDIGAYMAYWPQKQLAKALLNGGNAKGYDGKNFFATNHPVDGSSSSTVFANDFTGGASGSYPGALPIDDSVTTDVALVNLAKAIAYVRGIKMPNGEDPRMLRATSIFCPPRMVARVQQLTNARFIAQAAASGGGSGDIAAIISNWGLVQPQEVPEFAATSSYVLDAQDGGGTVTGSDTTWYMACEELASSQLGAMVYVDREPFKINYHTPIDNAELDRLRTFEWDCQGRNVTGYGHPFMVFRFQAS